MAFGRALPESDFLPHFVKDAKADASEEFMIVPANKDDASPETKLVLGACHALVDVEGKIVGDPIEKAAISGWQ